MTPQLSPSEIQNAQTLLADYAAAQPALATLTQNDGDLETSLGELVAAAAGTAAYGPARDRGAKGGLVASAPGAAVRGLDGDRLLSVFLRTLRREICGDDSFLEKVETYNKNPGKSALFTGLIVYVIEVVTIPINPAIATIAVLWILKLGLRTFCEYTDPATEQKPELEQEQDPEQK